MAGRRLRIAIDARYLSHGLIGGVHSYARNVVPELVRLAPEHDFVLWIDSKAPFDLPELEGSVTLRVLPWQDELSSIRNDLRIGAAMLEDGADIAHFPGNYGLAPPELPAVITLHDAINILPLREILRGHPKDPRSAAMMTYLHIQTKRALRRNPFLITVSNYSKREIVRHSAISSDRIRVIYRSPERAFRELPADAVAQARARWGLRPRVLVADAIKNPGATLRAYRALPESLQATTSLVFFSRRTPPAEVQEAEATGECKVFTGMPQGELIELLNLADLLIFPSWYEGFGLPVMEAMACGTPAIVSDRGSLPEVVGDAGIVTGAEDHDAIAHAITQLLEDPARYAEIRARALARAANFTVENEASAMLDVYASALAERSHTPARRQEAVRVPSGEQLDGTPHGD